jgi:hypothetical protein
VKEKREIKGIGRTIFRFQVEVFWVFTPCRFVVGYNEDGGSMDLRNVGILPQHYTAS